MKNGMLLLWGLLLLSVGTYAQGVHFEKDSLAQGLRRARQENKPVFVLVAPPALPPNASKELQKSRLEPGLNAPEVSKQLNARFLNYRVAFDTPAKAQLAKRYAISMYPTYLYLDTDGTLLYRACCTSLDPQRYLKDLEKFEAKRNDPNNLSHLRQQYEQGKRDAAFLKQYITLQQETGVPIEQELLDAYVNELPVKAFDSFSEVLFVYGKGPIVDSKAYKMTRLNQKLIDSLYKTLPLPERVKINNRIISNTMQKAIASKDRILANRGADFARGSWTNNPQRGYQTYEQNMLNFYRATHDTTSYLRQASMFYDRYYMTLSNDSVQARAVRERAARMARMRNAASATSRDSAANSKLTAATVAPSSFVVELNSAAWEVYKTGTRTTQYLTKALAWSKRTISLDPHAYNYDTLAHLLYRLQFFSEAEAMQQQAIALAEKERTDPTQYRKELQKIKARQL
ncbi:hypothetical protein [Hymenobacter sp. GOD-10R]|uniref:hypothetical protein n=1 Tax=Hymenobacter sp. GOD-10R TaxID=3093922 RepID=UPI002D7901F5|nr:hypothetical protein [Hymenobacter sp. GOD-10R]WRQ28212.1 hypothetical protein SD425_24405 [Hymenobacter sp. GOD-10R]